MEHVKFDSIPRLYRKAVYTEKIDGMNAALVIQEFDKDLADPDMFPVITSKGSFLMGVQSRTMTLGSGNDLSGLWKWAFENSGPLALTLGVGRHYGEWWGQGIQRGYHQKRKYFSLFNTKRWTSENTKMVDGLQVVPVLYDGIHSDQQVYYTLERLRVEGSIAAKMVDDRNLDFRAEGLVIWHTTLQQYAKVTLDGDGHKGAAKPSITEFNKLFGINV